MRIYCKFFIPTVMLSMLFALVSVPAASEPEDRGELVDQRLGWRTERGHIVSKGNSRSMASGILVEGIRVEAEAVAIGGNPHVPFGEFSVTFSLYSPEPPPGSTADRRWQLTGIWTAADPNAPKGHTRARYNPAFAKGAMTADLPFNPLSAGRHFTGKARLTSVAGKPARYDGSFVFNERFEGTIVFPALSVPAAINSERRKP